MKHREGPAEREEPAEGEARVSSGCISLRVGAAARGGNQDGVGSIRGAGWVQGETGRGGRQGRLCSQRTWGCGEKGAGGLGE